MSICAKCGFDALEQGKACAVCGEMSISAATPLEERATEKFDDEHTRAYSRPRKGRHVDNDSRLGTTWATRYRIESVVGTGGMGTVFRVTDLATGGTLALKILHATVVAQAGGSARFQREVEILTKLEHASVPTIYDFGMFEDEMYFVTEFIEGDNLREVIRREGPLDVDRFLEIVKSVIGALETAHEKGVVHRDIKPHNIMIDPGGGVHLLDFGLARGVGLDMQTITATGMIVGTPEYMSPEQFEGSRVDGRSDVYSLGVVMFQMATGKLPFEGDTPMALALKHTQQTPPDPRSIRDEVPSWLARIILRCLEKDPRARFATAGDLGAALAKSRDAKGVRRRMPNGDWILIDDDDPAGWAMSIVSPCENKDWPQSMCLSHEGRYYRLELTEEESGPPPRWIYRFRFWPESEAFRKFVDYAEHCAEQRAARQQGLSGRLKGLFKP